MGNYVFIDRNVVRSEIISEKEKLLEYRGKLVPTFVASLVLGIALLCLRVALFGAPHLLGNVAMNSPTIIVYTAIYVGAVFVAISLIRMMDYFSTWRRLRDLEKLLPK